ncbi:hypothetical protein HGO37_08310 [Rhizobium sp. CG4]|jgi:hypothetical protein|uniref:hypothetical protein n=1 Tax=Rhizobium/Agrobacterium group TaxID=227290 RepID=UPI001780F7F7|nr:MULTISPECIES: hypothetical protein [Rhizobium/Agrobacterium group]MBD9386542.1 hypothetical protein [Agrobacterium sp. AGB01]MCM2455382.1 hypothetical protein [Rhizobium sp. CG4]
MKTNFRALLLASSTVLAFSGTAFALDGNDLLKKINESYKTQGAGLTADAVETNGSTVVFKGAAFSATTVGEQKFPLGDITFEDVEENNGGYHVGTAKFDDINFTEKQTTITVTDMYMKGITIPAAANAGSIDGLLFYDEAHSGEVKVKVDGKDVVTLEETTATMNISEDKNEISFDMSATGFQADLSDVKDPASKEALDKLAIKSLAGQMSMEGTWEVASGKVDISDYTLELDDIGSLSLAFGFSGYTLDFIKSMQETVKAQAENPNKEQADQAAGLAMLGLAQQLSFVNAEISFTDDSISKRALDFAAEKQGMTSDQLAQTIKGMAPLMMAQLNLPELQNAVSAAVNAYVDDPKKFTISAAPENPVPFPMIIGAAMGAPNTLPTVLGVTVSAND